MFRRRHFSFSVLIPHYGAGAGFIEVTPQRRDMLYAFQMCSLSPLTLGPTAFYIAGVTDRERRSARIHDALLKNGALSETGVIDTTKIGPKFIHQLAFLDRMSQKNLVNVLFFWEEEVQRLRKLGAEEGELDGLIAEAQAEAEGEEGNGERLDQLKFARERVRMKRRQRPSQRREDLELDRDTTVEDAFRANIGVVGGGGEQPAGDGGMPPSYYAPQQSQGRRHWSVA